MKKCRAGSIAEGRRGEEKGKARGCLLNEWLMFPFTPSSRRSRDRVDSHTCSVSRNAANRLRAAGYSGLLVEVIPASHTEDGQFF